MKAFSVRMKKRLRSIHWQQWQPKLVTTLRHYRHQDLAADLIVGVTVGLVALPLAMAFGIASGVTPQAGICTATVGGFLAAAPGPLSLCG
jgi:SulP family sulfate permease